MPTKFGPKSTKFGRHLPAFGQSKSNVAGFGPTLAQVWPTLVELQSTWQHWPSLADFASNLRPVRHISAKLGHFGRFLPEFARLGQISACSNLRGPRSRTLSERRNSSARIRRKFGDLDRRCSDDGGRSSTDVGLAWRRRPGIQRCFSRSRMVSHAAIWHRS